jgi:hypothetical protein
LTARVVELEKPRGLRALLAWLRKNLAKLAVWRKAPGKAAVENEAGTDPLE